MDIQHGTRPKSTELIYSIYNTFNTFLSREIDIVSGRSISNIVANPGKHPQNGTNKTQNGVPLRMKEKNCDDEKKVSASQLTACDLFGRLVIYLLRGWFLNCLSPAFAAASAECASTKEPDRGF